jgi:hypothetical protein
MFAQMRLSFPPYMFYLPRLIYPPQLTNRSVLGISPKTDILGHISSLPAEERPAAHATVCAIESTAMMRQEPQPGLGELMEYLEKRGVRKGICTRNFEYVRPNSFSSFRSLPLFGFCIETRRYRREGFVK